ncbi:MAG TPA: phage holin family protein [Sphingomicrobium sp.]|nr:phage holin family protein [Sphingomicrobium sp.]
MLKPTEPGPGESDPAGERPIGELVNQLIEDGKAYATAELNVARAVAAEKVEGFKLPAILFAGAFLFLQAAAVVFGMTLYLTLVSRLGPFLAGLMAVAICLGIASGLAWYAIKRLRTPS